MILGRHFSKNYRIGERTPTRWIHRYAITELQKDVDRELAQLPASEQPTTPTQFAIFVVHNKLKEKIGNIPSEIP